MNINKYKPSINDYGPSDFSCEGEYESWLTYAITKTETDLQEAKTVLKKIARLAANRGGTPNCEMALHILLEIGSLATDTIIKLGKAHELSRTDQIHI